VNLCKDVGVADLTGIFKAYDVRGVVPEQLDGPVAHDIGAAFAAEVIDDATYPAIVVGHDMRPSSAGLAEAFTDGVRDSGVKVIMLGLCSTDLLYFASGRLDLPGAMVTASHNPAAYNGLKLCGPGAVAWSEETGLGAVRRRVAGGEIPLAPAEQRGSLEHRDLLLAYAAYLHDLVPVSGRRLKVVVDAGNAMAGLTAPAVLGALDLDLVGLFFELDGTFPNHEANPLDPANLVDVQAAVRRENADVGLAFDGDADRCFVVDEHGDLVSPSALTALIAIRALADEPGARIIHNLITSRAVPEIVSRHGGVPVRTRVGHSLIKATMARTNAVFGGEHSGHFYFRDFWYADSGMLAALHLLAEMAASDAPLSALVAGYDPYVASGEINAAVVDSVRVLHAIWDSFGGSEGITRDDLDGLTLRGPRWWLNVRASNTEPVLRLNVEAETETEMIAIRDRALSLMAASSQC
jgi:phosphomannomutase